MIRQEVNDLVGKGHLPGSASGPAIVMQWQESLGKIKPPLSDEEAEAVVGLFPKTDDECFGLAWSMIHLVETAPHWPLKQCLGDKTNPWVVTLRQRCSLD